MKNFGQKNDWKVPFWQENDPESRFTSEMHPSP
jgi:hypothetical protein